MIATSKAAANAYQAALSRVGSAAKIKAPSPADEGDKSNFGAMLKDVVGGVTSQARASDMQSQAFAAGKSDLVDVVTSIAETEVAMETLVAVRDRVISAYEEILKMPI